MVWLRVMKGGGTPSVASRKEMPVAVKPEAVKARPRIRAGGVLAGVVVIICGFGG